MMGVFRMQEWGKAYVTQSKVCKEIADKSKYIKIEKFFMHMGVIRGSKDK
jgi:hypothetical protein